MYHFQLKKQKAIEEEIDIELRYAVSKVFIIAGINLYLSNSNFVITQFIILPLTVSILIATTINYEYKIEKKHQTIYNIINGSFIFLFVLYMSAKSNYELFLVKIELFSSQFKAQKDYKQT